MKKVILKTECPPWGVRIRLNISREEMQQIRPALEVELNERNIFKEYRCSISDRFSEGDEPFSSEPDEEGMWEYVINYKRKREEDKLLP